MSPWWASSVDKSSFETCSSSDMDSEVPSMQLLTGVLSSASASFDDSEHSFLSTLQSPYKNDDVDQHNDAFTADLEKTLENCSYYDESDEVANIEIGMKKDTMRNPFATEPSCSSWGLVTKHTLSL